MNRVFTSNSPDQTDSVGREIASLLSFPMCVYLEGDMGAGKTTLAKSIINAFGYQGAVTSPTYNLVQEYPVSDGIIYHMDLYRLEDPGELEFLALDDLWEQDAIFLIEWAERGQRHLRAAERIISISKKYRKNEYLREINLKKIR